ncbi:MAG: hypothetical protein ACR2G0_02975 [Chthoniobacterales bacterium]
MGKRFRARPRRIEAVPKTNSQFRSWSLRDAAAGTQGLRHRLGGRLMCFGSIILLIVQFMVPPALFVWILLLAVAALVVWAFYYSWCHAKTLETERKSPLAMDESERRS